jgi:hypothetical protein
MEIFLNDNNMQYGTQINFSAFLGFCYVIRIRLLIYVAKYIIWNNKYLYRYGYRILVHILEIIRNTDIN